MAETTEEGSTSPKISKKATKKKTQKILAIELFALNPSITSMEVAKTVGVSDVSIRQWRQDPMFIDKIYERYMNENALEQLPMDIVIWKMSRLQ